MLVIALVVLVYAALQTDVSRKAKDKGAVSGSEATMIQYVNVSMLIAASLAVLYAGYQLFMPSEHKAKIAQYF